MHTSFVIAIIDNYEDYINESWDATFTLITSSKHKRFRRNLPLYGRINYYTLSYDIWRKIILAYHGHRCDEKSVYCHGSLHLHHMKSVINNGTNLPENIQILCELHHALKHPNMCIGDFEFNDDITESVLYNSVNEAGPPNS